MSTKRFVHFSFLPPALNVLYTMALLVLGTGYIFAMIQIYVTHAGLDGKPGIDVQDIVIGYSGSQGKTRLESALDGPMKGMLPTEERATILTWIHAGASEQGFDATVKPIVGKRCLVCHGGSNPNIPNLNGFNNVSKVVTRDTGMSLATLVRVSHIHLFGLTFIFFITGLIFVNAYARPVWFKCVVVAVPFAAILTDISAWYLTKYMFPTFGGWVVLISGAFMGTSFGIQFFMSLYQMWFYKLPDELVEKGGQLPLLGE
jgi:hypothetical protein